MWKDLGSLSRLRYRSPALFHLHVMVIHLCSLTDQGQAGPSYVGLATGPSLPKRDITLQTVTAVEQEESHTHCNAFWESAGPTTVPLAAFTCLCIHTALLPNDLLDLHYPALSAFKKHTQTELHVVPHVTHVRMLVTSECRSSVGSESTGVSVKISPPSPHTKH